MLKSTITRAKRLDPRGPHAAPKKLTGTSTSRSANSVERGPPSIAYSDGAVQPADDARDALVLESLPLVKAIAVSIHSTLPLHVDLDDLFQAGILGLIDAASKFDSSKAVTFQVYAKYRIKGAILDSLRQLDPASRDMRRRQKQVSAATWDLTVTLQRPPTDEEIASKLGMELKHWRKMMLDIRNVTVISVSVSANDRDEDVPARDFPSADDSNPDVICGRSEISNMLVNAAKGLPLRYQTVIRLYYTDQLTMKEVGHQMGVNESRVSQIHKSALQKMALALRGFGVESANAI